MRVVGVGGVEKGKVGDMNCVIDRRGFLGGPGGLEVGVCLEHP